MNSTDLNKAPSCPTQCLVRALPDNFADCLREEPVEIDQAAAVAQHKNYTQLIKKYVQNVSFVPPLPGQPDSVYIEDVAVITGHHALVTRPGAPSRQAEVQGIAEALGQFCTVHTTEAPASIDGGDVMQVGNHLLVGLSKRTNHLGFKRLEEIALLDGITAHALDVKEGLHLKSAMTVIDHKTIIYDENVMKPVQIPGLKLNWVAAPEALGANILAFEKVTIVSEDAPKTAALLKSQGHHVETVKVTELHKGDGALTCLSLRIAAPGCWAV